MVIRFYGVPSTSALVAFESAARHNNFSRAAEELNTSQSAISRHVANLERRLGVRLFERRKQRLRLTDEGEHFRRAVVSALEGLETAALAVAGMAGGGQLTIACTHEISHLFILPRYENLAAVVGDGVQVRVMTHEYEALETALDPRIDLTFEYSPRDGGDENRAPVLTEAVMPVCSPRFAAAHADALAQPVAHWQDLAFLELTKRNQGWATWEDWFAHVGLPGPRPNFVPFDNYVYVLEAAAAGRGLALGWSGLVDRYLDAGTLVAVSDEFVATGRALFAFLTKRGQSSAAARRCFDFLTT